MNKSASKVGRTCIITGSNSGVGFEAAKVFGAVGYHIIMGAHCYSINYHILQILIAILHLTPWFICTDYFLRFPPPVVPPDCPSFIFPMLRFIYILF